MGLLGLTGPLGRVVAPTGTGVPVGCGLYSMHAERERMLRVRTHPVCCYLRVAVQQEGLQQYRHVSLEVGIGIPLKRGVLHPVLVALLGCASLPACCAAPLVASLHTV